VIRQKEIHFWIQHSEISKTHLFWFLKQKKCFFLQASDILKVQLYLLITSSPSKLYPQTQFTSVHPRAILEHQLKPLPIICCSLSASRCWLRCVVGKLQRKHLLQETRHHQSASTTVLGLQVMPTEYNSQWLGESRIVFVWHKHNFFGWIVLKRAFYTLNT
jgi:hypothetical protein